MHSQISHRISVSSSSIADTFRERLSPLLSINSSDSPNRAFQASELNSKTLKSSRASSDCAILTHERQPQVINNHVNTPQKDTKDVMADQGNHDQILGVNIAPNATHDANTGESSGNGENPLRDPLPIPGVSPPVVVYPHSASMIPPGYKNRFYDIVTLFRQNTVQHQKLSRHARDIDYCLKLCGPSGGQPCPSILVFCCPGAFSALRSLLSQKFLRNQYCVRKSTRERFWSSLSSHASEQETPRPYFELYFWRSPKPRVLLGFDKAEIYIGRGIPTSSDEDPGDYSWLTLSGLPIYQSPGELQASTIGCMLQIGPRYYGLVARHGIRDRYKRPLDTFNGMESRLDEEANQSNLERSTTISLDAELPYTFEISTDMDGIDDKEEYDSLEFDDDVVYEELSDMEEDEPVPPKMDNREGCDLRLIALCPSFEPSNMPLEELDLDWGLDLDWALIPLVEPIYQRPNAFLNPLNMSRPTFISSVVAEIPSREPKDVLIISSPQTVQSGILQPSLSLLGSINDSRPSPVGSLILKDLKGLVQGNSGSLVIDAHTYTIYGHVIGSNPLGEIYISTLSRTLKQIEKFHPGLPVLLPQPMFTLARLLDYYARIINTRLDVLLENQAGTFLSEVRQDNLSIPWIGSDESRRISRFLEASKRFFQETKPFPRLGMKMPQLIFLKENVSTTAQLPSSQHTSGPDEDEAESATAQISSFDGTAISVYSMYEALDMRLILSILKTLGLQQAVTTMEVSEMSSLHEDTDISEIKFGRPIRVGVISTNLTGLNEKFDVRFFRFFMLSPAKQFITKEGSQFLLTHR